MSRVLGVLGGMGPAATLDFLAKLQAATPAARDQDHIRVIADINPRVPDRNLEGAGTAAVLAEMARNLARAGAQLLAMPCNTAHAHADAIEAASGLPLVDMIDSATARVAECAAQRIGLLATASAAELYGARLAAAGLETVRLSSVDQQALMSAVYRVKAGEAPRSEMARLAQALAAAGAQAIIAGCTEVPLALAAEDAPVPLIDAAQSLAERCVTLCAE